LGGGKGKRGFTGPTKKKKKLPAEVGCPQKAFLFGGGWVSRWGSVRGEFPKAPSVRPKNPGGPFQPPPWGGRAKRPAGRASPAGGGMGAAAVRGGPTGGQGVFAPGTRVGGGEGLKVLPGPAETKRAVGWGGPTHKGHFFGSFWGAIWGGHAPIFLSGGGPGGGGPFSHRGARGSAHTPPTRGGGGGPRRTKGPGTGEKKKRAHAPQHPPTGGFMGQCGVFAGGGGDPSGLSF